MPVAKTERIPGHVETARRTPTRRAGPGPSLRRRLDLERLIMGAAILALFVLVLLPLCSLLLGSIRGEGGVTIGHFVEALSSRLYLKPLYNSLILGVLTGLFSVLIGLPMAWAVSRTNIPGRRFIRMTATLSYLSPPFLLAIAYVNLLSPNSGLINVFLRDVLDADWLTFNIFSMAGLVLVTVPHTFPYVFLLASSALQSVDASYEEAAEILGAGKVRTALLITAPLVAPAILSGALLAFVNAIALFGSQAIVGLP
ncbi:MAG: ABC transporter permease, partial [Alphaproteobacteria bacterium]